MNEFLTRWNNVNVTMKQPLKITYWDFRHWHQFSLRTNVSAWFEMHIYHCEKKVADWCSLRNSHDGLCFRWGSLFTWKCWLPLWFDSLTADNQLKVYVVSGISLVRSPYPLLVQFVQQLVGRVVRSICGLDHQGTAAKVCKTTVPIAIPKFRVHLSLQIVLSTSREGIDSTERLHRSSTTNAIASTASNFSNLSLFLTLSRSSGSTVSLNSKNTHQRANL